MSENEIAVGGQVVPLETLQGYEQIVRLARSMMRGWLAYAVTRLDSHELQLLQRQIVNLGDVADFFQTVSKQHEEWIKELVP